MPIAPGFDPKWTDVPDYILGITREIWERRGISSLTDFYGDDLIVRSPASVVRGNAGIIAATQATLAEFPDRQLPGEDVIWCWADAGRTSFLSSHRLLCQATHTGPGVYGQPTGKRLTYRILADCYCAEDQVRDEWLVRDQSAIVRQLELDPQDWTRALIRSEGGPESCIAPYTAATEIAGPYSGSGIANETSEIASSLLLALLNGHLNAVASGYDRAAEVHYPGHTTAYGHEGACTFWQNLRSAFPSAEIAIHHQIGRQDPQMPPRAALRWSLAGRHDGPGTFGPPTGADVYIMGITHAEFGPRGLRREWTLIDETAIWKQILLHTGDL